MEDTEIDEVETYEETPRAWVYTTRSGRRVFTVPRLIVPLPHNEEDEAALKEYDEQFGEDCTDGLSERSEGDDEEETPDDDDDEYDEEEEEEEEEEDDASMYSSSTDEEEEEEEEGTKPNDEIKHF